jgi:predicted ATPase
MYKRLAVSHFKSIEHLELELGQINVFVGSNGSGKSNVIDAVRFVRDAVHNGLDRAVSDRHGIESVRQWSPTRPYRLSVEIDIERGTFLGAFKFSIDSKAGQYRIFREEAAVQDVNEFDVVDEETGQEYISQDFIKAYYVRDNAGQVNQETWELQAERDEALLTFLERALASDPTTADFRVDQADELWLSARSSFYLSRLRQQLSQFQAYSIYPNTLRLPQEPSNETFLASEGRNLASVFKRMRKSRAGLEALNQITDGMRAILPTLERISILSVGGYLVPQFHMQEQTGRRHIFNVSQMSDGSLRVLGLLTALYQVPRPTAIALEEPEQTVNPGILTMLAESIREVSKRTQVFVTTHSPHFLDQFTPDEVISVELKNGLTRAGRVSSVQVGAVRDRLFSLGELLVTEGIHS